ncbi:MAG TPA: TatD family hydrolase [candidate division Zixibacteria bacterium]|nr:TatD family hydrolase [candidate division Zixibacteria bacterium]MDD4916353.1 TatD family hydrolase [candidate division Zixibacteria bacterium]MDM7971580.1 TatD family hydrolase [candidate division Zixibacteria bacterium]HPI32378.1 TatD family hydrolase [candidate division Zixibacteria bacterium]HPM37658.1 TatD family hydrolase [candidate division Zixibacteria bacterium]
MIDSHCHLDFAAFEGRREEALADARAAGVHTVINIGVDLAASERSVALAEQHAMVYATVGVHPHDATTLDADTLARLRALARHEKVVAVGEIGLDFFRDRSPRETQKRAFHQQLELAIETALPVVIHTREAFRDTVAIVREYAPRLRGGVFHCFPGDIAEAREAIDLGFVISVGGVITFGDTKMARVAQAVPLDRIILETDAPFLTPAPHRGKTNYPAYVRYVYRRLAELKELPAAHLERTVDGTVQKLFGLVETLEG